MKAYLARVDVTLKPTVNDPQGNTIRDALHALGFAEVGSVRAGKYMEIRLDTASKKKAEEQVTELRVRAGPSSPRRPTSDVRFSLRSPEPRGRVRVPPYDPARLPPHPEATW